MADYSPQTGNYNMNQNIPTQTVGKAPLFAAGRYRLSWMMAFFAAAFLAALLTIAAIIGSRLIDIRERASEMAAVAIPETVKQNQQALKAETLARHAEIVLHATSERDRANARQQAATILAELADGADEHMRGSLDGAELAIFQTADAMVRMDGLAAEIEDNIYRA